MDKLSFLDPSSDGSEGTSVPEALAPEPAAEGDGRARGPDGKFVAREGSEAAPETLLAVDPPVLAPEPTPVEAAPATPQAPAEAGLYAAMLDERDKRKALEAQIEQLKAAQPAQTAPQQDTATFSFPNPEEDPQGFEDFKQRFAERREFSREIAELKHGPELVKAAQDWGRSKADSDPQFNMRLFAARNPYDLVIREYQRDQLISQFSDPKELEAFKAWKASQADPQTTAPAEAAAAPPASAPPAPARPPPPPRSIAQASSAGGADAVPTGPGQAYGGVFG